MPLKNKFTPKENKMEIKKPDSFKEIFNVFFYAVKHNIFLVTFTSLIIIAGINFIFIYLGIIGINGRHLKLIIFLCLVIDLYYLIYLSYYITINLNNYFESGEFLSLRDTIGYITNDTGALLVFPLLLLALFTLSIFLNILISLLANIPYAGSFIYSSLYIVSFALAFTSVLFIFAIYFGYKLIPSMIASGEGISFLNIIREIINILHRFWPKLTVMNIISFIINFLLTLSVVILSCIALVISFNIANYFTNYQFAVLVRALPFYNLFEAAQPFILPQLKHLTQNINYIPEYYKVSAILFSLSITLVILLNAAFYITYSIVSNYFIYNILKSDLENTSN